MNNPEQEADIVTDRDYRAVSEFLFNEARLLDSGNYTAWLALMSDNVRIRLVSPVVVMSGVGESGAGDEVILMDETMGSLKTRIRQLSTPTYTIAENPKSVTRRFVTNILIKAAVDEGALEVYSNVLVFRSRASPSDSHVFSLVRNDLLQRVKDGFRLALRNSQLDEAIVGSRNISSLF